MKKIFLVVLVTFIVGLAPVAKTEAATTEQVLLYSAAALIQLDMQLNRYANDTPAMTQYWQAQTGVLARDPDREVRVESMMLRIQNNGLIKFKHEYKWYITPKTEFNASCGLGRVVMINKGIMDYLDDDELAAILGHELAHGEGDHAVDALKKNMNLNILVSLYVAKNNNGLSQLISSTLSKSIQNEVYSIEHEWAADKQGYDYYVAAGYNPGGMAAAFAGMRYLGSDQPNSTLFTKIFNPRSHPPTTERIKVASEKMTEYSKNHVKVKNESTVQIDGKDVVTPVKNKLYQQPERAFLVAGNLARVYHDNLLEKATVNEEDGSVYIGSQPIMTPSVGDLSAAEIAAKINEITGL